MNETTWVIIITIGIILACTIAGAVRGFVKMAVSLLSLVITVALVWLVNPYVSDFIKDNTNLYSSLEEKCQSYVKEELDRKNSAALNNATEGIKNDKDGEKTLDDSWLKIVQNIVDQTSQTAGQAISSGMAEASVRIASALADIIVKIITFIGSFIVISLALRFIFAALNVLTRLPVIHTLNKTAGALMGAGLGLSIVWIAMLIAIVFFNTSIGAFVLDSVSSNEFMRFLYDFNPLIMLFVR